MTLSCVREEKLAVLLTHNEAGPMEFDIWITTKIEADKVSWSKFLRVETETGFFALVNCDSFFIDEEKKIAVVCNVFDHKPTKSHQKCYSQTAHIIGQDGYLKSVPIGESRNHVLDEPLVFSSYVPSLVQLGINQEETQRSLLSKEKKENIRGQV